MALDIKVPVGTETSAVAMEQKIAGGGVSLGRMAAKTATHSMEAVYQAAGVGFGAALMALLSELDYEHEKKLLKERYENEIGARVGKAPEKITKKDMENVARENKTLGDALRRLRWRRNLSVAVTTLSMFAAFGLSDLALSLITIPASIASVTVLGAPLAAMALSAVVSFSVCVLAEKLLTSIGEKSLRIGEPEVSRVERKPELQKECSVSGQIHYLSHLQSRNVKIEPEQVVTVFLAANPKLAAQVEKRFGVPFDKLPPSASINAIDTVAPGNKIQELTDSLNAHLVRAQELAFNVEGKASGVPKLASPQALVRLRETTALERELDTAQEKIDALHQKVNEQAAHIAEKAHNGAEVVKSKLGFAQVNSTSVGTQPIVAQQTLSAPPAAMGKFTSQVLSERQQQAMQPLTVGA